MVHVAEWYVRSISTHTQHFCFLFCWTRSSGDITTSFACIRFSIFFSAFEGHRNAFKTLEKRTGALQLVGFMMMLFLVTHWMACAWWAQWPHIQHPTVCAIYTHTTYVCPSSLHARYLYVFLRTIYFVVHVCITSILEFQVFCQPQKIEINLLIGHL